METDQPLRAGDPAPDFTLAAATGEMVTLSDYLGRCEVVVFFYPRDNTAVCSAEACSFRDRFQDFQDSTAQVIGISTDSPDSHLRFAERLHLPLPCSERSRRGRPRSLPRAQNVRPDPRPHHVLDRQEWHHPERLFVAISARQTRDRSPRRLAETSPMSAHDRQLTEVYIHGGCA